MQGRGRWPVFDSAISLLLDVVTVELLSSSYFCSAEAFVCSLQPWLPFAATWSLVGGKVNDVDR